MVGIYSQSHPDGVDSNWGIGGKFSGGYRGLWGKSQAGVGVYGQSFSSYGILGTSLNLIGVCGESLHSNGVHGKSMTSAGVFGESETWCGVIGSSSGSYGVKGFSQVGAGAYFNGGGAADIILGGHSDLLVNDDGVIQSEPDSNSSDMRLISNHVITLELDNNNDENGHFEILNGSDDMVFSVDESGSVLVNGVLVHASNRDQKENIRSIENRDILEKITEIPIQKWNYIGDKGDHIGPMAQDFYRAFGLGKNDKGIATVDGDGIALAAIQALHKENLELKRQIIKQDENFKKLENAIIQIRQSLERIKK